MKLTDFSFRTGTAKIRKAELRLSGVYQAIGFGAKSLIAVLRGEKPFSGKIKLGNDRGFLRYSRACHRGIIRVITIKQDSLTSAKNIFEALKKHTDYYHEDYDECKMRLIQLGELFSLPMVDELKKLSAGQKILTDLCLAVCLNPHILVFDNSLDVVSKENLVEAVKLLKTLPSTVTVILSTKDLVSVLGVSRLEISKNAIVEPTESVERTETEYLPLKRRSAVNLTLSQVIVVVAHLLTITILFLAFAGVDRQLDNYSEEHYEEVHSGQYYESTIDKKINSENFHYSPIFYLSVADQEVAVIDNFGLVDGQIREYQLEDQKVVITTGFTALFSSASGYRSFLNLFSLSLEKVIEKASPEIILNSDSWENMLVDYCDIQQNIYLPAETDREYFTNDLVPVEYSPTKYYLPYQKNISLAIIAQQNLEFGGYYSPTAAISPILLGHGISKDFWGLRNEQIEYRYICASLEELPDFLVADSAISLYIQKEKQKKNVNIAKYTLAAALCLSLFATSVVGYCREIKKKAAKILK